MAGDASTQAASSPDGGTAPSVLDGASLRRWARLVARRLEAARADIDALNVFPVPDGDTGTNLHLTVAGALADHGGDLARALLVNARGNSGVIASQMVRGWADVLTAGGRPAAGGAGAQLVAKALRRGDEMAWAAVGEPVEGTVLSVSRAAADRAEQVAGTGAGLQELVDAVLDAAEDALRATQQQLPALAAAGVVDAGGAGLVVALRALRDVVHGDGDAPEGQDEDGGATALADHVGAESRPAAGEEGPATHGPAFEVMYLLEVDPVVPPPEDAAGTPPDGRLREALAPLGDSVGVAGGDGLWHVHVHTDDPGAAVEVALAVGTPRSIRITHLPTGAGPTGPQADQPATVEPATVEARAALAVVACAGGEATAAVCRDAGAVVVTSAPGERASTGDVLAAVLSAGAGAATVLVLPNDAETAAVAHQAALAAEEQGVRAVVGRSRAQVQVLAALAVVGPGVPPDGDVVAGLRSAEDAVAGCRPGAVARAARDCRTPAGPCPAGGLMGTVGRDVVAVGTDVVEVAGRVLDALDGPAAELVTLVPGRDLDPAALEQLVAGLQGTTGLHGTGDGAQVHVVGGGQPRYLLLLGCE